MKKLLSALCVALAAALALAGCNTTNVSLSMKSYFLASEATDQVAPIDETYTYAVTHDKPDEDDGNSILSVDYNEGMTYVMRIQNVSKSTDETLAALDYVADGEYYKLTAELKNVSGTYRYKKKGAEEDVSFEGDGISAVVYFRGTIDSLKPVYSEKKVVSTSPILRSGISAVPGAYEFPRLEYTVTGKYADEATVVFTPTSEDEDINQSLSAVAGEHVYKKYTKKNGVFFDTEQILFACRSLTLGDAFSGAFNTADVTSDLGAVVTVNLSTAQKNAQIQLTGLEIDWKGETVNAVNTYALNIRSGKGGATQIAYYALPENNCMLIRYTAPISDRLGSLVYTLTEVK